MFVLGKSECLVMKVEKVNKEIRSKGGRNPRVTCPTNTHTLKPFAFHRRGEPLFLPWIIIT